MAPSMWTGTSNRRRSAGEPRSITEFGRRRWPRVLTLLVILAANSGLHAEAPADGEDLAFFEQHIRPVLVEHCYACHSERAEKLKGGLLLDSQEGWRAGGDSGEPVIVPGDPDASLLIKAVRYEDGLEMPPGGRLPEADVARLVEWVQRGAPDPRTGGPAKARRADKLWWSLQPLAAPVVPEPEGIPGPWADSPIDRFIFARLAAQGLAPNPPADPRTLIRRMSYDVVGLPPAPEDVDAFVADFAADPDRAVEQLADRLLESFEYGEHWGRHWLDVVRFGESHGFERNVINDEAWPFRDYVIESLNADKPFNQFIIEHLAGDVIGRDQLDVEIGSAFLVVGPYDDVGNQDAAAQLSIRAATLDDVITAAGSAFLGLTINCARCHDHKFDPVPTEDYYRLRAAFEGVTHGARVVATAEERAAHAAAEAPLVQRRDELQQQRDAVAAPILERARTAYSAQSFPRPKVDLVQIEEQFPAVTARAVKLVMFAHTASPTTAAGSRIAEFEIWTAGPGSRNVARSAAGARAEGARALSAEDFPDAYGPQLAIDGAHAEQYFVGSPAELVVHLAEPARIDRVTFANSRGPGLPRDGVQGETPCEYEVQVSSDGAAWTTVASSADRTPWSEAHGVERVRRTIILPEEQARLNELDRELADVARQIGALPPLRRVWVGAPVQPAGPTYVHVGGDPLKPGAAVPAGSLSVLGDVLPGYELPADAPEGERRLALAMWIARDDNPLTVRVLANRVWHYHFGAGIVDTPSDFGFLGGQPTHPELLDWLAGRLVAHGWRLKPLHREILLSQAYRQSSALRREAAAVDAEARLLWRFPPRRLTAEELRDTLLAVAGVLDRRRGGPGFRLYKFTQNNVCTYFPLDRHGPDTYRRAVYHQQARASVVDLLSDFDLPDNALPAPRRASTTSPLQALTLLNHQFTLEMSAALMQQAEQEAGSTEPANVVEAAYRRLLQRAPTAEERAAADELLKAHGGPALGRALFNLNELIYVE